MPFLLSTLRRYFEAEMEVFSYRTGIFKEEEEISVQNGGNEKKILATTNVYQDFTWVLEKINRNVLNDCWKYERYCCILTVKVLRIDIAITPAIDCNRN